MTSPAHDYSAALAPHPWDAVGAAPPFGHPYPGVRADETGIDIDDGVIAAAKRAAELLRSADEDREEAERLEDSANDSEREAKKLIATFRETYPALAEAIEEDPYAIDSDEDVIEAAA